MKGLKAEKLLAEECAMLTITKKGSETIKKKRLETAKSDETVPGSRFMVKGQKRHTVQRFIALAFQIVPTVPA